MSEYASSLEWLIKSMLICEKLNCSVPFPCVIEESSRLKFKSLWHFQSFLVSSCLELMMKFYNVCLSWSSLVRRMGLCFSFEPRPVFRLLTRFSHILDFHSKFFIFLWARTAEHAWAKPLLRSSVNLANVKFHNVTSICLIQNISHSIAGIMNIRWKLFV